MNRDDNPILQSIREQLSVVSLINAPRVKLLPQVWRNRIRYFLEESLNHLLPLYLSSCPNVPHAEEELLPWLMQNERLGLEALTNLVAECSPGQTIAIEALQHRLEAIEFEIYANRHRKRWIQIGPYVVSAQAGRDREHILTFDVYKEDEGYVDAFSIYSDTDEIPALIKKKFPSATPDELESLVEGTLLLASKPEDWVGFFRHIVVYPWPNPESLEAFGFQVGGQDT